METFKLKVPVVDSFPSVLRWYGRLFDETQFWLIDRSVCMRHQEHKVFHEYQVKIYPSRSEGGRINNNAFPVMREALVGVPGWVYPHVNIIDMFGLNDYVVARSRPGTVEGKRQMAHERGPPRGYVESYQPNVLHTRRPDGTLSTFHFPRKQRLTAERINQLERQWRASVQSGAR